MPGLVTSPARSQASGSRQTTSPQSWCRPTGVPAAGVPQPATKGNRPHACAVVAWYSGAASTWAARPAHAIFQPHGGGTGSAACSGPVSVNPRPDSDGACRRRSRRGLVTGRVITVRALLRLVGHPAGPVGPGDPAPQGGGEPRRLAVRLTA